jgi:hypothetical protein
MANRYWIGTGGNYNATANWSATSGGAGGSSVPTNADDVFFDANSGDCVVNVASVGKTINFTGYTNTITMTAGLTISGNVTLVAAMTIAGASNLTINANATLTSNGKVWPNGISTLNSFTLTLGDNCEIGGTFTKALVTTVTLTNNQIKIGGGLNVGNGGSGYFLGGSANIILNGTGTWQGNEEVRSNLEINTTGTITISGTVRFASAGKTLKYTAGTISASGSTLNILNSCTLDLQGQTINNLTVENSTTFSFTSDVYLSGALTIGVAQNPILNSSKIYVGGNFSAGTGSGYFTTGTTEIVLNGTGTWTGGDTRNTLTINTAGTITLSGTILYGVTGRTFTYTAGTIAPGTSTFTTAAGLTYSIASSGFTLWNWSPLTGTHTINTSTITVNNNFRLNGNTTFAGTGGWSVKDFTDTTAGRTMTLKDGSTYTVTSVLSITGTNASRWTITSSSATLKALFTLSQGASQTVVYVNGTRVDSSGGQTVWSLGGTLTDTINWNNGTRPNPFNTLRMA